MTSIRAEHETLRGEIANTIYEYSTEFRHIFEKIRQSMLLSVAPSSIIKEDNRPAMNRNRKLKCTHTKNIDNGVRETYYRDGEVLELNVATGTSNDLLSIASSSDSESLFIPRQSSDSLNTSPIPAAAIVAGDASCGGGDDVDSSLYHPPSTASIGNSADIGGETSLCYPQKSRKFEREKEQLIEKHREETRRQNILHKIQIDTLVRSMARRHSKKIRPFLTPSPELYNESTRMGQSEFLKSCIDRVEYVEEE